MGGCGRRIPVGTRKGRCADCLSGLDARRNAITPEIRQAVIVAAGGLCQVKLRGCLYYATAVDHIVPVSRGGADDMSNYQAACGWCNSSKRDR